MSLLSRIAKALTVVRRPVGTSLVPTVSGGGGWMPLFGSRPAGDFQNDIRVNADRVQSNWAVFACMTLIAGDIGKVSLDLMMRQGRIWVDAEVAAFSPVIRRPNRYQNRQKFIEQWALSKLTWGNTYVLKERDDRRVVRALHILDPSRVTVLVGPDGAVYYQLGDDDLAGIERGQVVVPASEIIHDRFNCLFHPLVGLSPIFACGIAATQGLEIQVNSAKFFGNASRPSGVLTAPGQIGDDTAKRIKEHWEKEYTGSNTGKVAVLGDGLAYEAMTMNAVDAELVKQLELSATMICSTFHVPAFKIGAGTIPAGQKVEGLNQIYYSDCLHALMDSIATCLTEGLGLDTPKEGKQYAVRFDLEDLLKMDSASFIAYLEKAIKASIMAPDEARAKLNLPPVPGGGSPMVQQQNFSLAALAKRDAKEDPFAKKPAAAPAPAPEPSEEVEDDVKEFSRALMLKFMVASDVA